MVLSILYINDYIKKSNIEDKDLVKRKKIIKEKLKLEKIKKFVKGYLNIQKLLLTNFYIYLFYV